MATGRRAVAALREELQGRDLDGFLVPRADAHQGEYVPACAERLAWVTGFTGSAGMALVLCRPERAVIWVDGRYSLQVRQEVDQDVFEHQHLVTTPPHEWIAGGGLPRGCRLGYDPWLHTPDAVGRLERACRDVGAVLVPVDDARGNPVDAVWIDRPPPPRAPIVPHPIEYTGRASAEKRAAIGQALGDRGVDAATLTDPASIAWLLNVRGADVPHTPLPLSFAVVCADGGVAWFVDAGKLTDAAAAALGDGVLIRRPEDLGPALDALGAERRRVLHDPKTGAAWIRDRLAASGATVVEGDDPCLAPKARKNDVEIAGFRDAHVRDGAAVVELLAWIGPQLRAGAHLTERGCADRLAALRADRPLFRDLSFATISGFAENGAVIHYRATEASDRRLHADDGALYLLDSGGQYLDGTTDITRTVALGTPTGEQRDRFTRVLRGHIDLATARFTAGVTGGQLDTLARAPLWEAGLDYDHGTGHGVGSYLGVHEGPQRIHRSGAGVPLEPGMILSNEPGYYRAGAYGIRIESLVVVRAVDPQPPGAERTVLELETITLCPIDRSLVDAQALGAGRREWLDAYHSRVHAALRPHLTDAAAAWLDEACLPV